MSRKIIDKDFFEPAGFLQMLRVFGLFDVGVDAEGNPLQIPVHLLEAGEAQLLHRLKRDETTATGRHMRVLTREFRGRASPECLPHERCRLGSWGYSRMDKRRRVVITGIGCINPLGNDVETMWSALKAGRSGVGP